jgi:methionyl-tRNA formyltransferase
MGTPRFAVASLKVLIDGKEDVSLVVTQPDRAKGRGHVVVAPPIKELALSLGIETIQPLKLKDESLYSKLSALNPEFIIVVAYGRILPLEILKIPKYGCINVHASLLPKYRGAAPIQWAVLNGDKVTGVTTMLMDEGLDTGDMLVKKELSVEDTDTTASLFEKLSLLGAEALIETINGMRAGIIRPVAQSGEATYAPPLKKQDGRIDWQRTTDELFNFVRGMYPWPGAFCYLNNERIKIIKVRKYDLQGLEPGIIVKASGGELIVGTGRGCLLIDELQPDGKKPMPASAFLAGRKIREHDEKFS